MVSLGAILLAVGLVGTFAWYAFRPVAAEPQRFVALYVTDLPGGFDELAMVIAGATVGEAEHPLHVDVSEVEISKLHGPEEGLRVASGWIPRGADGQVSLIFASAKGLRGATWVDLAVPKAKLTIPGACPAGDFASCASLFDFSLEQSIVRAEGGDAYSFQPFVQNLYHYGGNGTPPDPLNVTNLVHVPFPEQFLDQLAQEIIHGLCARMPQCSNDAGPGGGGDGTVSTTTRSTKLKDPPCLGASCITTSTTATTTTGDGGGGGNHPPDAPTLVSPEDGAQFQETTVTVRWSATDPDAGDTLTFTVKKGASPDALSNVHGCTDISASECTVEELDYETTYHWTVVAKDNHGKTREGGLWSFTTGEGGGSPTCPPPFLECGV